HGSVGPPETVRPSGALYVRSLPSAWSKKAKLKTRPRSRSTATYRRSRMRQTKWINPDSNCSLHPHADEYEFAVFGSGRVSPALTGTLVLFEPFSIRSQSVLNGYTPLQSFFSMPEKYMFAVLIRSSRDMRSAGGIVS